MIFIKIKPQENNHATTTRKQHKIKKHFLKNRKCFATGWNRTNDTRIFSPLLYQLSYSGFNESTIADCAVCVNKRQTFSAKNHTFLQSAGARLQSATVCFCVRHVKVYAVMLPTARVKRACTVRATLRRHVVKNRECISAHAAQNRLLTKRFLRPPRYGVRLALGMTLITWVEFPAAFELNRHNVSGVMIMHASRVAVHRLSVHGHGMLLHIAATPLLHTADSPKIAPFGRFPYSIPHVARAPVRLPCSRRNSSCGRLRQRE